MSCTESLKINEKIEMYKQMALDSPLGKAKNEVIKKISSEHDILLSKLNSSLRLAIIGEVKAGKSTLLNAIAKGEVSPTNVSEATAAIIKVEYSEKELASIHFLDGTVEDGNVEDIFSILKKHLNDQEYFSRCSHVDIKSPLDGLKSISIIDTPGLGTITEENEERTLGYFQDVDVVLWVFNGNYLGQSNINDRVRTVYDMGKKIIAVINRIDEVDGDSDELIEFLDDSMGNYFEAIFPLSAKMAYKGRLEGNIELIDKSGYTDLFTYIRDHIDSKSANVQMESIQESNEALKRKLLMVHDEMQRLLREKLSLFSNILDVIENAHHRQINEATNDLMNWINTEFLVEEKATLLSQANTMGAFSGNSAEKSILDSLNNLMKNPSTKQKIDSYVHLLSEKIISSWKQKLEVLDEQLMERFELKVRDINSPTAVSTNVVMMDNQQEGFGDSMTTAVVAGGAIATYVAVVGPAAAHVGLGAAMGGIMPPLLLAGAAVGVVKMFKNNKEKKERVALYINSGIEQLRNSLFKTMQQEATRLCDALNDKTLAEVKTSFGMKNLDGRTIEETSFLIQEINLFLQNTVDNSLR